MDRRVWVLCLDQFRVDQNVKKNLSQGRQEVIFRKKKNVLTVLAQMYSRTRSCDALKINNKTNLVCKMKQMERLMRLLLTGHIITTRLNRIFGTDG